jgi:hypothetical protein
MRANCEWMWNDRMVMAVRERFSEEKRKNPPHTFHEESKQRCGPVRFPRIHNTHHNNKAFFGINSCEKRLLLWKGGIRKKRTERKGTQIPQGVGISTGPICVSGLYTWRENEYSTLAVKLNGEPHERNGYRT